MAYKVAGIDVHKKVLMVVVCEVEAGEVDLERRRFGTTTTIRPPVGDSRLCSSSVLFSFSLKAHSSELRAGLLCGELLGVAFVSLLPVPQGFPGSSACLCVLCS